MRVNKPSSCGHVAGVTACDDASMHHSERDLRELTSGAVVNDGTLVACSCSVSHREIPIYYMRVSVAILAQATLPLSVRTT